MMNTAGDLLNNQNAAFPLSFCIVLTFIIFISPYPLVLVFHLTLAIYFLRFTYKQWKKFSPEFKKHKALITCILIFLMGINFYIFAFTATLTLFYRYKDIKTMFPNISLMTFVKSRTGILYFLMSLTLVINAMFIAYQSRESFSYLDQIESQQAMSKQKIESYIKSRTKNNE